MGAPASGRRDPSEAPANAPGLVAGRSGAKRRAGSARRPALLVASGRATLRADAPWTASVARAHARAIT